MGKLREVEGIYGSEETPSIIFVSEELDGGRWYVAKGGVGVNYTYDGISDGVNIELLSDVDTYTVRKPINSLGDLQASLDSKEYGKGGKVTSSDLFEKIKKSGEISEQELNLIKTRLNSGKIDAEGKELVQWIWDNSPKLSGEQNSKGHKFLMNLWKSPTGKERSNSPFGYREQEALEKFKYMQLAGFHDTARFGQRPFYIPLYNVIGEDDANFQYYYNNGEVSIVGAKGGEMGGGKGADSNNNFPDLFGKLKSYLDESYSSIANPQLAIGSWLTTQPSIDENSKTLFEKLGMDLGATYSSPEIAPSMAVDRWAIENKVEFGKGGKTGEKENLKAVILIEKGDGWNREYVKDILRSVKGVVRLKNDYSPYTNHTGLEIIVKDREAVKNVLRKLKSEAGIDYVKAKSFVKESEYRYENGGKAGLKSSAWDNFFNSFSSDGALITAGGYFDGDNKMAKGGDTDFWGRVKHHTGRAFDKSKELAGQAHQKAKEGYSQAEAYTRKKIHDGKKDIALQVIGETIDKTPEAKYRKPLRATEEIVYDRYAKGGKAGYKKFKEEKKVKTTVYMSVEDVGADIPVGTTGVVESEPKDNEELVAVMILGSLHFLPQDVLEVTDIGGSMATGGEIEQGDRVIITTTSLGKEYDGMKGEITSRKLSNDKYSIKLDNGMTLAFEKGEFRHNSINPKYGKGGSVAKGSEVNAGLKVENEKDLEEVAKYMAKAVKKSWDLKDLIHYFEQDNGFDYKVRVKIADHTAIYEMPKTYDSILGLLKKIVEENGKKLSS